MAVLLHPDEIKFLQLCCLGIQPLTINRTYLPKRNVFYEIVNPPGWTETAYIEWYDGDKLKANIIISSKGLLKWHSFTVAAFLSRYNGIFKEQLQGLLEAGFGKFDAAYK